jgi:hypothetical protein
MFKLLQPIFNTKSSKMNEDNNNTDSNEEEEKFSNDPEEQLRIENELLRLKLQAETGADLHELENVPPEVENAFLNNILAFERQLDKIEEISIYTIIGEPKDFKPDTELDDNQIESELERLNTLLEEHQIEVDYGTDYSSRLKYKFITEELFEHETQKFDIPEMVHHFIYEEFHPNHMLTLEGITEDFLEMWLQQRIEKENYIFSDEMVSKTGVAVTKEQFFVKVQHVFDAYLYFENSHFSIDEITFEMMPDTDSQKGFGCSEGIISYDAILENKEVQHVKSPFKLYMQLNDGYWDLMNVVMPGFEL